MSATNRGAVRNEADFYPTPAWCVHRLLERAVLPGGEWLEPAVGGGAIVAAVNAVRGDVAWTAIDTRVVSPLDAYAATFFSADFLSTDPAPRWSTIITNPPFSLAFEFVQHALRIAPYVVMLLRVNFLGSAKRSAFFRNEMPDIYVLPNRPSFTGKGTDATEYAWMVWTPESGRRTGRIEVLAETSAIERRAA